MTPIGYVMTNALMFPYYGRCLCVAMHIGVGFGVARF